MDSVEREIQHREQEEPVEEKRTIITGAVSLYKAILSSWSVIVKIIIFILIVMLSVSIYRDINDLRTVFNPFKVPKELMEKGYTGEVVTLRLRDEMNALRREIQQADFSASAETEKKDKTGQNQDNFQHAELDEQMDIELPGIGLSLRTVTLYIIRALRLESKHTQINGYIVIKEDKQYLTVQISKKPAKIFDGDNTDEVIKKSAEYVLNTLEPQELGMIYYGKQDEKNLASLIQHVWQNNPSKEEKAIALVLGGYLANLKGNISSSEEKFEAAAKIDEKNVVALYMSGEIFTENGKHDEAEKAFKKAIDVESKNVEVYIRWADLLAEKNKYQKVEEKYKEALKEIEDQDQVRLYLSWGNLLRKKGDDDDAVQKYKEALLIDPSCISCYLGMGRVFQWYKNNPEKAVKIYKEALLIDDRNIELYDAIGRTLINDLKRIEDGLHYYKKVVEQNENDHRPYLAWASALIYLRKYEGAIEKIKQADKIKPDDSMTHFYWGYLFQNWGKKDKAIEKYKEAIDLDPDNIRFNQLYGLLLKELNKYEESLAKYKKVVQLDPYRYE